MQLLARRYDSGQPIRLTIDAGQIAAVEPLAESPGSLPWIAPALFDLQINGCDGISFNSATLTAGQVRHVLSVCRLHGIAGLCPTLVTNDFPSLKHGFATLRRACEEDRQIDAGMPCFHLEGPYISPEDGPRGAHPRQHVRPPSRDEFLRLQDAAGGRIRLLTLAPEHDNALDFIAWATAQGVVVAIGHTAASGQRIRDAVAAGARLSTHLGNGCHALLPRHDNCIWEQAACDSLWASLICDGHHLPATVVRCLLRIKTPARAILTCDASSLAGLPPGRYREWGQDIEVQSGGKVVLAGTAYLAGSGVFTDACVDFVLRNTEWPLSQVLDMASARPRELLRLPTQHLAPGEPAELILFDYTPGAGFQLRQTFLQ